MDADFRQVERLWRDRVERAWNLYRERQEEANRVVSERLTDLDAFGPGGVFAIRQARSREMAALKEYVDVLRIYADLVAQS